MKGTQLRAVFETVGQLLTDKYGLILRCGGSYCYTDGDVINIPALPEELPDELFASIRGYVDHECAHVLFTQINLKEKFLKQYGQPAFELLNTLEDARIDRLMGKRYPGSRDNLEVIYQLATDKISRQTDLFEQFCIGLYQWVRDKPFCHQFNNQIPLLVEYCRPELDEFHKCKTTKQVSLVVAKIWDKLLQLPNDHPLKTRLQQSYTAKEPENVPEHTEGGSPEQAEKGSPEQAEKEPAEQSSNSGSGNVLNARNLRPSRESGIMQTVVTMIETGLAKSRKDSDHAERYSVYTTKHDVVEVPKEDTDYDYHQEFGKVREAIPELYGRLLRVLRGQQEDRWLSDRPNGRLDSRTLHRITTGQTQHVFRQRIRSEDSKPACTLLLDLSSSMSRVQIGLCGQLALLFAETLSRLSFPTEIIGFSTVDQDFCEEATQKTGIPVEEFKQNFTRTCPLYYAIFKNFNESWKKAAARLGHVKTLSLTPLGESLLFAGRRLANRPEKRKVLFCLTDGKPVVGAWDEQVTLDHACQAVRMLTEAEIETVGIGIREDCVRDIFPHYAVVDDLDRLLQDFLKQLCSALSKGGHAQ